MQIRSATIATTTALCAVALLAAGCGSDYSSTDSTTSAATTSASTSGGASAAAATIDVADNQSLGPILTDADGNTVYLFEKDEADESYCSGECASVWPPVTTDGDAQAGDGADASLLTTIERDDGTQQVAYDGHPLYLYQGDSKPGDANGNGLDQFGAEWYALTPDGSTAEGTGESASESSTTTSSDGY